MSDTDNLNPISTLTSQDNFEDLPVLYLFVGFFVMASLLLQCLFYCIKASSAISLAHESIDLFVLQSNELAACTWNCKLVTLGFFLSAWFPTPDN
jgi:hypothetical protein